MPSKSDVTIVTPLWSPGVGHVGVQSWEMGTPPDPLNILGTPGAQAPVLKVGGGDAVNDWTEEFPYTPQQR